MSGEANLGGSRGGRIENRVSREESGLGIHWAVRSGGVGIERA